MLNVNRFRRAIGKIRRRARGSSWPLVGGPAVTATDVRRAYQTLLGRAPESEDVIAFYVTAGTTLPQLFRMIAGSPEFAARWNGAVAAAPSAPVYGTGATDAEVLAAFDPYTGPGKAGFVTDFLGTRTRTYYVHGLNALDGVVEGLPNPGNFHASTVEWVGVLRSALDADRRFVAVELGAGWGPWLTACAAACSRKGIPDVKLVGVEAAGTHFEFMKQHFRDNGLDPERHTLLHGASAPEDGFAEFPDLNDPALDYGATLSTSDPLMHRVIGPQVTRVPTYSLPTLLAPYEKADLLHIDIQGSEADVVVAARGVLKRKVKRMVIGTHGRAIEQTLLEELSANGWVLEADHACRYGPYQGGIALAVDGCQVWRNPAA